MATEVLNERAVVNKYEELAALLTLHTDGKRDGVHKTDINQLAFTRISSAFTQNSDAVNAAYQVGYESPSQFSREYSRMFGAPPIRDVERLRMRA